MPVIPRSYRDQRNNAVHVEKSKSFHTRERGETDFVCVCVCVCVCRKVNIREIMQSESLKRVLERSVSRFQVLERSVSRYDVNVTDQSGGFNLK